MKSKNLLAAAFLALTIATNAQPASITVDVAHPGHEISPMLWGIFFEDINLSADGGIYPELVRNRSFEDSDRPDFWRITGADASIDDGQPLNTSNIHSLRLNVNGMFTLENDGYWGMNIVAGESYTLKLAARGLSTPLTVKLVSSSGQTLATGKISSINGNWNYYSTDLTATGGDPKAHLEISGNGQGVFFLDMVSLMPDQTWKNHGLRVDLAESLEQLHPSFMRFPGGNWIEGDDFDHMYHWKYTIGNIDARTPLWNTWGYNTTQGLGYYEYLQLCEDIGAEPVFGINCGLTLGNKAVPTSQMGPWIQDALDAVEYANGPANSHWGALRAAAGHPGPFHLKYLEIGNENGGKVYWERWKLLADALRAKYPEVKLIMTTSLNGYAYPPTPSPDIIDEHYYESPESFMRRATQYDSYDRNGPKIFIGEYAVTEKCGLGNLRAAIGEAAFMTGMERNSDVVKMASYAPLFVNMNHRAWNPDLINFDSSRWYGLPSYYAQQMFAQNRGDVYLPTTTQSPLAEEPVSKGRIGVGTWNTAAEFKDIKVTAPGGELMFQSGSGQAGGAWQRLGDGADWHIRNGVLRQNAEREFIRALAGDKSWTDYNLTLKARKISGAEGFLILFHISGDEDRQWWNIGGWGNTQDGVEAGKTLDAKPARIETGRWYDLRLEVRGKHVKCFLNGRLVHDLNYESDEQVMALYATASKENQSGDVIVKVVNANPGPLAARIDLNGGENLAGTGTATVLTSGDGTDENSLDDPRKVVPKTEAVSFSGTSLARSFPGNSFTVFRLQPK